MNELVPVKNNIDFLHSISPYIGSDFFIAVGGNRYQDGDVINNNGRDLFVVNNVGIPLDLILSWPGLEDYLSRLPQIEPEMDHIFSGGVYVRQIKIPENTFIIGKRHRRETCNMLLSGELSVYLGDNNPVTKMKAPMIVTSDPMVRKIAYCHKEAIFLNLHPTDKKDINDIEKEFIVTEKEFKNIKNIEINNTENMQCLL